MKTTIVCKRCGKGFEHPFDRQSRKRFCADCLKAKAKERLQNSRKEMFSKIHKGHWKRMKQTIDFDCFGNMENTIYM